MTESGERVDLSTIMRRCLSYRKGEVSNLLAGNLGKGSALTLPGGQPAPPSQIIKVIHRVWKRWG